MDDKLNPAAAPATPAYDPAADGWKKRGRQGFIAHTGPMWARDSGQGLEFGMLADVKHLNPAGVVHGGALTTLIDSAVSTVAWEAMGRVPCLTVQLDVHFMDAVRAGEFVVARAEVMRATAHLVFMRGTLVVGERAVVSATAVMKILKSQ